MIDAASRSYFRRTRIDRRFLAIIGLSMTLHASLFAITYGQRQAAPLSLPPIFASIRPASPAEPGPVAVSASPAAPATVLQKVRQHLPRVAPLSAPRTAKAAGPTTPAAPSGQPELAAAPTAPFAIASPANTQPNSAEPAAPRPQAELLAGYRQRLSELFARHQEYPRIAALRGWEGEVRLRLKVARKGNLLAVHLDHSSGFAILDQHALAMLESLAGLPALPDALDSQEIQVVVPINYKLKKTT